MAFRKIRILAILLFLTGCAHPYAERVKFVGLDGSLKTGTSIGPIKGEDCTVYILGYPMGRNPTLDKAVINARMNVNDNMASSGLKATQSGKDTLRYITNMSAKNTGFDIGLFGNRCITVTGVGYK